MCTIKPDANYLKALNYVANFLLNYWDEAAFSKFDNMKDGLNYVIGLGGGSSLRPHFGPYFCFHFRPGCNIILSIKKEDGDIKNQNVPQKHFFSVCEKLWNEKKGLQTSLF